MDGTSYGAIFTGIFFIFFNDSFSRQRSLKISNEIFLIVITYFEHEGFFLPTYNFFYVKNNLNELLVAFNCESRQSLVNTLCNESRRGNIRLHKSNILLAPYDDKLKVQYSTAPATLPVLAGWSTG